MSWASQASFSNISDNYSDPLIVLSKTISGEHVPPVSFLYYLQGVCGQTILEAFKCDCKAAEIPWEGQRAQELACQLFLTHPLVLQNPPRPGALQSFLKLYVKAIELQVEGAQVVDADPICSDLLDAHISMLSLNSCNEPLMCYKTFWCSPKNECTAQESSFIFSKKDEEIAKWEWKSVKVATDMFRNVGLSLWPAGYAIVQLLLQEFSKKSKLIPTISDSSSNLCIVELGAGVGLTPCILSHNPSFCQKVKKFCTTDYQVELLENIKENLELNKIHVEEENHVLSSSSLNTRSKAEIAPSKVSYSIKLIDWNELDNCKKIFADHGCDLILAADCIYDVSVVPALVDVIHAGLSAPFLCDSTVGNTDSINHRSSASAVVVQTHRQASTMKVFADAVESREMKIESYRVFQLSPDEFEKFRLSSSSECIRLDQVGSFSSLVNSICFLYPDKILPNGELQSLAQSVDRGGERPLQDGFIGPFYAGMVGLLGVHVLTLSPEGLK